MRCRAATRAVPDRWLRSAPARRDAVAWRLRLPLAGFWLVLGVWTTLAALGMSLPAFADNAAALLGRASDPRLAAAKARKLLEDAPEDQAARTQARAFAADALLRDPTSVVAAGTLGLLSELDGKLPAARRAFGYAARLSRRDRPTELWLIEDAVRQGAVDTALHHYDVVLRTQPGAADLLFPVLSNASNDSNVRVALVKTISATPVWASPFLAYVAENNAKPAATVGFFEALSQARVEPPEAARAHLVNRLVLAGELDAAWRYYATLRPGIDRRRSRDPEFNAALAAPTVFDWTTINAPGLSVALQPGASTGIVGFSAAPTIGGVLLEQVQLLPPGRYRLEGHATGVNQASEELPYWVLQCRADERELGRVVIANDRDHGGRFSGEVSVGAGCPAQVLRLVARPSTNAGGLSGQLDHLRLAPAP